MLASFLGSGGANGGFNLLYQIGGPRSIQLPQASILSNKPGPARPFRALSHCHCGLITSMIAVLPPRKMYWYQDFFSLFPFSMFLV
jgi:hypothetical protein